MTINYWNEREREEAPPITVLASLAANQYEELRTGPTGLAGPVGLTGPAGLTRRTLERP